MLATGLDHLRTAVRFAHRHRRAIALSCVAAAAVTCYCKVQAALKEAEAIQAEFAERSAKERRFRLYLGRARAECRTAILNFLPTLRSRLYATADISRPVRALKALRQSRDAAASAQGEGGDPAPPPSEEDPAEAELWDEVKVTSFTRLLLSMYAFSALNLMLRLQMHILGRYSYEEASELLKREAGQKQQPGTGAGAGAGGGGERGVGASLPMDARRAFLSSTYEFLLGDGLRALAADVEAAVRTCSADWHCQSKLAVGWEELAGMLRRVRAEVEGGVGGAAAAAGDAQAAQDPLLRYIINPIDELPAAAAAAAAAESAAAAAAAPPDAAALSSGASPANPLQRPPAQPPSPPLSPRAQGQVRMMLNETWDVVESPNFSLAMKDCLDCAFDVLYRRMRERVFTPPASMAAAAAAAAAAAGRPAAAEEARPPLAAVVTACKDTWRCCQLAALVAELLDPAEGNQYVELTGGLLSVEDLCRAAFGQPQ
ncbi:Peroxin-3 [Tribonema minus]|uniref:Peroxin-3 n=1 Tax=Tribonema minus TaxID=303371 RepID=A0A835Z151_9STRA|nr:Peroxin-3 [Tribonema minus]